MDLVQGPPGTGKTFVGALVADAIVRNTSETILCVCYTNHALDQFLEARLDKGITDIVRIGSRSKSKRLENYNLFSLKSKSRTPDTEFRRIMSLRGEEDTCKQKVSGDVDV